MTDNFIQLNKSNVLRLGIKEENGEPTGEYLEFDLENIDLFLRYQDMIEKDKKNRDSLKLKITAIENRQDVKGKKLLSKNEEDTLRAIKEFFVKEIEVYNMFLGPRGVEKLLNGRNITWETLEEIDKIIEEQISPYLDTNMENIKNKIKDKYSKAVNKADEIEVIG